MLPTSVGKVEKAQTDEASSRKLNFLQEVPDFSLVLGGPLFQLADCWVHRFLVIAVLGPLLMFTPRMARARRTGLAEYGLFAQRARSGVQGALVPLIQH